MMILHGARRGRPRCASEVCHRHARSQHRRGSPHRRAGGRPGTGPDARDAGAGRIRGADRSRPTRRAPSRLLEVRWLGRRVRKFSSHPSEPAIRRLGLRSSTHIERPIRLQVGLAFAVALMLLAIPLYLLRRPEEPKAAPAAKLPAFGFSPSVPVAHKPGEGDERLSLGEPVRVRCSSSPSVRGQEGRLCDGLLADRRRVEEGDCGNDRLRPSTGAARHVELRSQSGFAQRRSTSSRSERRLEGAQRSPGGQVRETGAVRARLGPHRASHSAATIEIALLVTYSPPPPTAAPLFE